MSSVRLQPAYREKIRKLVDRPRRLNARIKAEVLLDAERDAPVEEIARRLGVPVDEVSQVVAAYRAGGLEAVGLTRTPFRSRGGHKANRVTPRSSRSPPSVAGPRGSKARASRSGSSSRSASWVPWSPSS